MIFVTLFFCHCEPRLKNSIFPSSMFVPHLVILLKDFHQIQMSFICDTRLCCIRLAFISSQSCLSCEETHLRCTEQKVCSNKFVRKCLSLEQKYLNQHGGSRVFYEHEFCGVPHQINETLIIRTSQLVVTVLVPVPGVSTYILLFISGNCLQNLACISIPGSGDRIVYYRSPIDCNMWDAIQQTKIFMMPNVLFAQLMCAEILQIQWLGLPDKQ